MKSKIIYIDMDDVIADFAGSAYDKSLGKVQEHLMFNDNFFLNLGIIKGARGALFDLAKMGFDIYILSQPVADCPKSYMQKVNWVQLHFPSLYNKIILTQNKGLCIGDFLIDDNLGKWKSKFEANGGQFIHFPYGGYNGPIEQWVDTETKWREIVEYFATIHPYK